MLTTVRTSVRGRAIQHDAPHRALALHGHETQNQPTRRLAFTLLWLSIGGSISPDARALNANVTVGTVDHPSGTAG